MSLPFNITNPGFFLGGQLTSQESAFVTELAELSPVDGDIFVYRTASNAYVLEPKPAGGGGITDGDKGDITVSVSGTVWTIDDGVITAAKFDDAAVIDSIETIDGNANDTSFPTSLAVKNYVGESLNFLQNYFFNDTADAIGGIYYQMTDTDLDEAGSTLVSGSLTTGNDQPLYNFINEAGLGITKLNGGIYQIHMHAFATGNKPITIYAEIYTRTSGGTETLIGTTVPSPILGVTDTHFTLEVLLEEVIINATDKLVVKFFANAGATGTGTTVTLNLEDNYNSRIGVPVTTDILGNLYLQKSNDLSDLGDASVARTNLGVAIGTDVAPALGADDNYVTDAEKVVIGNTSGTNTGDEVILSGEGAPAVTPSFLGQRYIDTTADTYYVAVGTASDADWEANGSGGDTGDVVGPASATDNALARFDTTTGKLVQSSDITLGDTNGQFTRSGGIRLQASGGQVILVGTNTQVSSRLIVGTGSTAGEISSTSAQNLILQTNQGTNSGTITIVDGPNGNITLDPNGTGEAQVAGDRIVTEDATQTLAGKTLAAPVVTGLMSYVAARGKVTAGGNLSTSETINFNSETNYTGNLDANITFTFANATSGDDVTLYLTGDGTQRTITWPPVTWLDNSDGSAPAAPTTTGETLVVTVRLVGSTYFASATGNYAVYA